ncbi:nucleotide exchange factor GrpE [Reyranella sp.]|jgi:molecular chaperone GrpE|uniref:nucleotide exchange factor GrpE n=1 Tax=Reyranella sp. TaxID=1929291 RepID=UPI000BC9B6F1|nr:nucleotide exchange factor GrpE [Reyranella sp.]OYY45116.1 MAG: nucleotide exchange factor GrpE [Rhodospirillales bacterium 35-66-84]OYZ95582.1 MAG: nucleotide exchange factor GrpE [Rhodospirillales bacterium 24-66-33]OZB27100.1 MAG: nucleotide exchange factor GrpE [Rhodospirillales bacterium 39-66-50]HQS16906.1 nucleotide exchange factor GrpE [Reyranella sp.]HQT12609.1 nucleotide exchange factor GrpE [Reyranella sp.]
MASDPTAGGAPADMPVDPDTLDIPPRPESAAEWQRLVEQLQAEKADLQDKQLRALAEAQNVRRRAQQDVEKERKFAVERFARDVLSVADNFGRALSALPADLDSLDPALRNVIVGIQATDRELQSVLERHGVTRIASLGKPFNAEFHQAMMEVENPDVPHGTVVQELIPGYLIAGRLLRAAMVAVSKGGPAAGAAAASAN